MYDLYMYVSIDVSCQTGRVKLNVGKNEIKVNCYSAGLVDHKSAIIEVTHIEVTRAFVNC